MYPSSYYLLISFINFDTFQLEVPNEREDLHFPYLPIDVLDIIY